MAEINGELYFYTQAMVYEIRYHSSYEFTMKQRESWKFYALENGEMSLVSEAEYIYAQRYDGRNWELLPETGFTLDGVTGTVEDYTKWNETVAWLREIDGDAGYIGDRAGYTLEELLQICRAD